MKHEESPSVDRARPLKAAAIMTALVLVAPGVEAIARYVVPPQIASAADTGIDASYLVAAGDAHASLDRIEEAASASGATVPEAFAEEIGFLPGARDARANADGSVVGYVVSLSADDALDQISERMRSAGWTSVSLGDVEGATFVKSSGKCTWALVTCTQVGASTSVVVRSVIS